MHVALKSCICQSYLCLMGWAKGQLEPIALQGEHGAGIPCRAQVCDLPWLVKNSCTIVQGDSCLLKS